MSIEPAVLASAYAGVVSLCFIDAVLYGLTSGLKLEWRMLLPPVAQFGAALDCNLEWTPPDNFPLMFDEQIRIQIASDNLGALLVLEYRVDYAIVQSDELTMVQAIASY
jgi:hypothetical protein